MVLGRQCKFHAPSLSLATPGSSNSINKIKGGSMHVVKTIKGSVVCVDTY